MSETSPTASAPAFGPADWQAVRSAGQLELSRPNRTLIARLTLYAVLFLSAVATTFDRPFIVIGVIAAMGVPLVMFSRMRELSVCAVLKSAHRIVVTAPERVEASYREAAVSAGHFEIDGQRFDPAEVELIRVHRIHRTGEHMHRTHHVWLRTPDKIFELGAFPLPAEADELTHFLRANLPELSGASESSKADTLPHDAKAVAVTVVGALVAWGATFAAPFLSWGVSPAIHAAMLFAIGVGVWAIEAVHGWMVAEVSDSLVRSLRRRYRLGR
ncbi:MAG: hypothetical protein JJ863_08955 [Deltaproteobacteria bacterium]|nr:hypothetical protein [Deltaproteobacteria bacterium]